MKRFTLLTLVFIFSLTAFSYGNSGNMLMADEYKLDVQNQADGSITVTFDLLANPELAEIRKNRQKFSYFSNLKKFIKSNTKGYPEILSKQVPLHIDPDKDYTLKIEESEYETYNMDSPYLVGRGKITRNQDPKKIPYVIDENSLGLNSYPGKLIESEEHFLIRNIRGFNFRFNITEFNISQSIVRVYTHLQFRIVPEPDIGEKNVTGHNDEVVSELYDILPYLFLNYEDDRKYTDRIDGEILVIYTARDSGAIQPYIAHKETLGFTVTATEVPTGTNAKSVIQNAYDQNPNIFYVQLVGDWDDIKSDLGTDYNAPMDPMLGCVSGNDYYVDLIVGRFSASNANDVTVQVDKTIAYEQNAVRPFWSDGLGIGSNEGPGDDGESDSEHADVIKNYKLLPNQYSDIAEIYGSGSASLVADIINDGTHVINYTGHGSQSSWITTGFSSSDINNLANGDKLPIIFSVACINGAFHMTDSCFAETWLRKENGGAVATLMATINQLWTPPMKGQDYMNDLLTGGYDYSSNPGSGTSTNQGYSTFGKIILNAFSLWYTESSSPSDLETIQTWTIFGDASLNVTGDAGDDCTAPEAGVSGISENSISLSWDDTGADSYSVSYMASGSSDWTTSAAGLTSAGHTISGLADNTAYSIRVYSHCPDGSQPCDTVTATTDEVQGSCGAPEISITGTSETSISLSWNDAGASSYTIYYKAKNGRWAEAASGLTVTNYVLSGLTANTIYRISVRSICSDGSYYANRVKAATDG
ncbi:MAG: hypothetical protein GY750_15335 [Lentisphaerae bacterium]|nr:hypothetical protein [Lentisphaerota bacterium]